MDRRYFLKLAAAAAGSLLVPAPSETFAAPVMSAPPLPQTKIGDWLFAAGKALQGSDEKAAATLVEEISGLRKTLLDLFSATNPIGLTLAGFA